jgi:hypothetical protein
VQQETPGSMVLKPCRVDKNGSVKVLKSEADMKPGDALLMMLAMDGAMFGATGMSMGASQMAATMQSAMGGPEEEPLARAPY